MAAKKMDKKGRTPAKSLKTTSSKPKAGAKKKSPKKR